MDKEKLVKLLNFYKEHLNKKYRFLEKYGDITRNPNPLNSRERLSHILWMIDEMNNIIDNKEKVGRWLGFIQGAFWVTNEFTVDEMRNHNRGLK